MADSKTYLNVPYAQKDEAKALGARWDAANKKWYVPANKDIMLFAKWQPAAASLNAPAIGATKTGSQSSATRNDNTSGVFTHPSVKDFVPYDGDEPPWD